MIPKCRLAGYLEDWKMKQDKSWQALLYQYSQSLLQFVLNSQLNTLPSPANLRRWSANNDAICSLCTSGASCLTWLSFSLASVIRLIGFSEGGWRQCQPSDSPRNEVD